MKQYPRELMHSEHAGLCLHCTCQPALPPKESNAEKNALGSLYFPTPALKLNSSVLQFFQFLFESEIIYFFP